MTQGVPIRTHLGMKRGLDLLVSALALTLLLPLMLAIGLAVKTTSPGEVIFRQARAGKGGRTFTIYKFRTMTTEPAPAAVASDLHRDDARITRLGRLLRRTSLDELPQLLNILRGGMSIVGIGPDLLHHVEQYDGFQRQRLAVRPGVTGWAQIHGRNLLSWEERINFDVEYIQRWSLWLDLAIVGARPSWS